MKEKLLDISEFLDININNNFEIRIYENLNSQDGDMCSVYFSSQTLFNDSIDEKSYVTEMMASKYPYLLKECHKELINYFVVLFIRKYCVQKTYNYSNKKYQNVYFVPEVVPGVLNFSIILRVQKTLINPYVINEAMNELNEKIKYENSNLKVCNMDKNSHQLVLELLAEKEYSNSFQKILENKKI